MSFNRSGVCAQVIRDGYCTAGHVSTWKNGSLCREKLVPVRKVKRTRTRRAVMPDGAVMTVTATPEPPALVFDSSRWKRTHWREMTPAQRELGEICLRIRLEMRERETRMETAR